MTTPVSTTHRLTDDAGAVLEFEGIELAHVTSRDAVEKLHDYSTLGLWRTVEGRFVVTRYRVRNALPLEQVFRVFPSRQLTQSWLGFGALSLRLYQAAGWSL